MSTTTETPVTRYSGFRRPKTAGLLDTSTGASLTWLADLFVVMMTFSYVPGWVGALLVVQLILFAFSLVVKDADGQTYWERGVRRVRFLVFTATGFTFYRAKLTKATPLTGVLSHSVALEYTTSLGVKFVLIYHPFAQQYVLVLILNPVGGERHDRKDRDKLTAMLGVFGTAMGNLPTAAQWTITTESAPRTRAETRGKMDAYIRTDDEDLAAVITRERLGVGVDHHIANTTWASVTFNAVTKGNTVKAHEANATHIAKLMPGIISRLSEAGGGHIEPATERDAAEYARAALDPQARPIIEAAHAEGTSTGLDWTNCGPQTMRPTYDYVIHDGGVSQTLIASGMPGGAITDNVLGNLVAPHGEVPIKRVTLVKQVIDTARANVLTSRDLANAELRREANRRSGLARMEERIAARASDAQAEGHGLEDFTLIVTVTVTDPPKLEEAVETVRGQLAGGVAIRLRPAYGQQDTMLYYGLPFGLDLHAHSVSESVSKASTRVR